MTFKEKRIDNNWNYEAESWHGSFVIWCIKKLDAEILDDVFMAIISTKKSEGELKHKKTGSDVKIYYTFSRNKKVWLNNNEK